MEFNFLDDDNKTPPSANSLSEQAMRAGYSNMVTSRNPARDEFIRWEIERERIREMIIAAGNMRRQALEAEVRKELMMEREIARWKAGRDGLSLEERLKMSVETKVNRPPLPKARLPKASVSVQTKAMSGPNHCGVNKKLKEKKPKAWSCAMCQVRATSEKDVHIHLQGKKHMAKRAVLRGANNSTTKPSSMNTSIPAKPDVIAAPDEKLKNVSCVLPAETNMNKELQKEDGTLESKKRIFKFWCKTCQMGTHSEVVMETHKKGKKHVAQIKKLGQNAEAALTMTCSSTTLAVPNTGKKHKTKKACLEGANNSNAKPSSTNTTIPAMLDVVAAPEEKLENVSFVLPAKTNMNGKVQKEETPLESKKRMFEFWCEICQIGAPSEVVMETHKKGKKHVARIKMLHQNAEAAPTTSIGSSTTVGNTQTFIRIS